jgi:predicted S18 family serine protease
LYSHPIIIFFDELTKEVRNLNWKAALLLFVIFFASAVTTVAISLSAPNVSLFSASEKTLLDTVFEPMGDPVDGPGYPH